MDGRTKERYAECRKDIYKFLDALRLFPTKQQRELVDAVAEGKKKIACKSGQGPGKTTISFGISLWNAFRYRGTLGIVTAPTMRQCREVWLAEGRRILQRAEPWIQKIVKITSTRVTIHNQRDWGILTVTATNPEAAQGFHQERMFVVCDEASGIPEELITQYKGTLSNPNAMFLMIGNPNTRNCAFYKCFTSQRRAWHCITFNAEETPKSTWFDPARNEELAEEFGRDSDVYRVRVLGEFPHIDPECVIGIDEIERCTEPAMKIPCSRYTRKRQFGIDVARYGGDENVVYQRLGNSIVQGHFFARTDPNVAVDLAMRWQVDWGWRNESCSYVIDASGMGQGVLRRVHKSGKKVFEFHAGGRPADRKKFENRITEAWFLLAKLIKTRRCYLPEDRILLEQLSTRKYQVHPKTGKIVLESKKDYKARLGHSPDRADALVMAFYDKGILSAGRVSSLTSKPVERGVFS